MKKTQQIEAARHLLQLGERVSLAQLKSTYRRLCKQCHPDVQNESGSATPLPMQELNEAYQLLLEHCENYPIPLLAEEIEEMDDEGWWLERFGQDPLWGKG